MQNAGAPNRFGVAAAQALTVPSELKRAPRRRRHDVQQVFYSSPMCVVIVILFVPVQMHFPVTVFLATWMLDFAW